MKRKKRREKEKKRKEKEKEKQKEKESIIPGCPENRVNTSGSMLQYIAFVTLSTVHVVLTRCLAGSACIGSFG
jgi:hypothetical protein